MKVQPAVIIVTEVNPKSFNLVANKTDFNIPGCDEHNVNVGKSNF